MQINELFTLGMKRDIPELIPQGANSINLGCGNSVVPLAFGIDLPEWDAEVSPIPFLDATIDTVFAFHFLEHFAGKRTIELLREIERCLKVGGTANIVVPYYRSNMAFHDLDHKCFFTEDTFKTLFSTPYYDKNRETVWKLEINVNIIIGVAERNLCLMTQLVKKA